MPGSGVARRVARKELALLFRSPVAWLFLAGFAVVTLFVFFWVESFFSRNIADVRPLFNWLPLLLVFFCAAVTMRMWSEERRSGTLEHVMTQPVGLWRFVLGKFRACMALLLLALFATLPLPLTAHLTGDLDWGPVVAGYLAAALLGGAYCSVGLFVSARTDNPIVSLMGSVALCGLLYLLGSEALTGFFDHRTGDLLRLLGSGSRFESISRGVIDARDLLYYATLCVAFLALNVYTLERERWARHVSTRRHRLWRAALALLLLNLAAANVWMQGLPSLRLDITEGRLHTLSDTTRDVLDSLEEPLLLRGYFSARTHPQLSPLVAQLRDLLREYRLAGAGRVQVEWVDPRDRPALEEEANRLYGIIATPFQIADRYQSTLTNAYFDLLIRYGDEFRSLGYRDLIEVRAATAAGAAPEVRLRNPEFDITRAIRDTVRDFRSSGRLYDGISRPVEMIGYVSAEPLLPTRLQQYRRAAEAELQRQQAVAGGKLSYRFIEPEAAGGQVAEQIASQWGFVPMLAGPGDDQPFYFYLTLADDQQVVQLPTGQFGPERFPDALEAGLRRFARGYSRTVALALPEAADELAQYRVQGPTFNELERAVTLDYNLLMEDLSDGAVEPAADILAVLAPERLTEIEVFAIDQFLMRGGTVILATSPFTTERVDGELQLQDRDSGLQPWLRHLGVDIDESLVLDPSNSPFPATVLRRAGEYQFRDVEMVDYPYFVNLRGEQGLNGDHPVTANLRQVTLAWPSPISLAARDGNRATPLLQSSRDAWLSTDADVTPKRAGDGGYAPYSRGGAAGAEPAAGPYTLAVVLEGRFESWFADRPLPAAPAEPGAGPGGEPLSLIGRSPESARLVVFASNAFLDDRVMNAIAAGSGTRQLQALDLFSNVLDWALQDDQLVDIRARGHFNRTLKPMQRRAQAAIEYLNYGLALAWLALLALLSLLLGRLRRRRYARELGL